MLSLLAQSTAPHGPLPAVLFYSFAALTVVAAISVALARNIIRAAVALLFALAGMSGLYLLLSAEFLAAVQLVVYVGGTLILIVFSVMLTSRSPAARYTAKPMEVLWGVVISAAIGVPLVWLLVRTPWEKFGFHAMPGVQELGRALLSAEGYLVPFEVLSVLLLAVMIGAAYLAKVRREPAGSRAEESR